ncbi:MAG: FtsQ-type POTRA domain-containing protein [Candidatus Parcubacteria bacterium]|nr:FtsQ-type POTRA domain-containing protein [Candidatus Parcubacteria bacterium]
MFKFNKNKRSSLLASKKYKIERSSVKYRNPFRNKSRFLGSKFFKIINLILIIGILGCLYFFVFSDFYNITNIEVSGNQIIPTDDILDITNKFLAANKLLIFKNKNIFIFNRNDLKKKISAEIVLNNIKIEKIIPNTIRIIITEKDAALKWQTNGQDYLIGKEGIVIKRYYNLTTPKIFQVDTTKMENNQPANDNFIKIINLGNDQVNLGDKVLNPQDVEFIIKIQQDLSAKDYLSPKKLMVPNNLPQFLIIELANGAQLYFNINDSIQNQLNRLDILIQEKIKKENMNRIEYIDLRLGESVYYKFKEQAKQQASN